jgi:probable rRNA maturation factor
MNINIKNTLIDKNTPKINFQEIKDDILGKNYDLSLLICADKLAQKINKKYRNKNYTPNTLSFPYTEISGEIILNPRKALRESKSFSHEVKEHLLYLFIHSLLHLKGYTHGAEMEKEERKYFKKFTNST